MKQQQERRSVVKSVRYTPKAIERFKRVAQREKRELAETIYFLTLRGLETYEKDGILFDKPPVNGKG